MNTNKDFMPISIDIKNKKILIVGGGEHALEKLKNLQDYVENIVVIDKNIIAEIREMGVSYIERDYEISDIFDSFLVYAYTNNPDTNLKVKHDAERSGKLVNVLNNPEIGNFESPAVFKKSHMIIAVSSNRHDTVKSSMVVNSIRRIFQHDKFLLP